MSAQHTEFQEFTDWLTKTQQIYERALSAAVEHEPIGLTPDQIRLANEFTAKMILEGHPRPRVQQDLATLLELFQQITRCADPQRSCAQGREAGRTA